MFNGKLLFISVLSSGLLKELGTIVLQVAKRSKEKRIISEEWKRRKEKRIKSKDVFTGWLEDT